MTDQISVINEEFTGIGTSKVGEPKANKSPFEQRFLNFSISGLNGSTVELQASIDGGITFIPLPTGSFTVDTSKLVFHASPGVKYRFEVTIFGSGTIKVVLLN